jgi:hypothetical protein
MLLDDNPLRQGTILGPVRRHAEMTEPTAKTSQFRKPLFPFVTLSWFHAQ